MLLSGLRSPTSASKKSQRSSQNKREDDWDKPNGFGPELRMQDQSNATGFRKFSQTLDSPLNVFNTG